MSNSDAAHCTSDNYPNIGCCSVWYSYSLLLFCSAVPPANADAAVASAYIALASAHTVVA